MRKLPALPLFIFLMLPWVALLPASAQSQSRPIVKIDSLGTKGNRIEIDVLNPGLTKAECSTLINKYLEQAGPNGQVGIHKPAPKLRNKLVPFCVNNLDGAGTFFNDYYF